MVFNYDDHVINNLQFYIDCGTIMVDGENKGWAEIAVEYLITKFTGTTNDNGSGDEEEEGDSDRHM